MKNLKRSVSIICAASLIFSTLIFAGAAPSDNETNTQTQETTINEYEYYQKIISMSDEELMKQGCSEQEIREIRNFSFEDEIRKRAALDDDTLHKYGYTDEEIDELRSFARKRSISNNDVARIAEATLTTSFSLRQQGTRVSAGVTFRYVDTLYTWQWNRIPFFVLNDMIAIYFGSDDANEYRYDKCCDGEVKYEVTEMFTGNEKTYSTNWETKKENDGRTVHATIPLGIKNAGTGVLERFTYSGIAQLRIESRGLNNCLYIDAVYGHSQIQISPSFSLSPKNGADGAINFRIGMDEQHCCADFEPDFTLETGKRHMGNVSGL